MSRCEVSRVEITGKLGVGDRYEAAEWQPQRFARFSSVLALMQRRIRPIAMLGAGTGIVIATIALLLLFWG